MPVRAMRIHAISLERYEDGVAEIDMLVGSGTYVRSVAEALGGHCRTLRRTEIGPFSVDEADPGLILPVADALVRVAAAAAE